MTILKETQIKIDCRNYGEVTLNLIAETGSIHIEEDFEEEGEEKYQLEEGKEYEYEFEECGFFLRSDFTEMLYPSPIHKKEKPVRGRIKPGIYVGRTEFDVCKRGVDSKIGTIAFEIQSTKQSYRKDYQKMMNDITEYYTDLVMQQGSPVTQRFEVNPNEDSQSQYQKFAFIKAIIESEQFSDAIHKIQANPIHRWTGFSEEKSITNVKRLSRNNIRQLINGKQRIKINPAEYGLPRCLASLPSTLTVASKKDTLDTIENRFVKYALSSFLGFCTTIQSYGNSSSQLKKEAGHVTDLLTHYLSMSVFRDVELPSSLTLNSPALQRKAGYREILQAWLMFDLAAKLKWKGGDNVYQAGKRNGAALYEYWLFFKLMEIVGEVFNLEPTDKKKLVEKTENGINLKLAQGRRLMVGGKHDEGSRTLNISLYYNKTFERKEDIQASGSWTAQMRPDYTLSIWPGEGITEEEAERDDLIVHIHFDAKYRVNKFLVQPDKTEANSDELLEEKREQEKGIYKRADLLKMHAYKDAIRRTSGAYVLYPGTERKDTYRGFHEIIPGLGAFCMRPDPDKYESDAEELKRFIINVKNHFIDRSTLRERLATHTHSLVLEESKDDATLRARIPESVGNNRSFIPDETMVLFGYCKNLEHYNWVMDNECYNYRSGKQKGSFAIDAKLPQAEYILLHNGKDSYRLCKLKAASNRMHILSRKDLLNMGYPHDKDESTHNENDIYLVFNFSTVRTEQEYWNMKWNMNSLLKYIGSKRTLIGPIRLTDLINFRERI